jgi:hypothetical protein
LITDFQELVSIWNRQDLKNLYREVKAAWDNVDHFEFQPKGPFKIDIIEHTKPKTSSPIPIEPKQKNALAFQLEKISMQKPKAKPQAKRNNNNNNNNMKPLSPGAQNSIKFGGNNYARSQSAAAAYSTGATTRPPFQTTTRNGTFIRHREFLSNVTGTTSFSIGNTYSINPGLAASFPWLSTQAAGWEQYRFKKLCYRYLTRTGSNTAGSILMVPDYDAADVAPANEQEASTYSDIVEASCWVTSLCLELKTSSMDETLKRRFVRTGALAANLDIKTYDAGQVFICTNDGASSAPWGKLWVEYEIELFCPQLTTPSVGLQSVLYHGFGSMTTSGSFTSSNSPNSNVVATLTSPIVSTIQVQFLQAGTYLVTFWGRNNGGQITIGTLALTNCSTINNVWSGTTGNNLAPNISSTSATAQAIDARYVTASVGGTIVYPLTIVTSTMYYDIVLTDLQPNQP